MATYDLTKTTPARLQAGDIINVPYSGSSKSLSLPRGVYKLECWGAQGGNRGQSGASGGYSIGLLTLNCSTLLYLYVGGQGNYSNVSGSSISGGFNGGGSSHLGTCSSHNSGRYGNSGGGASDIRIKTDSLYARVIVAGGGGGAQDSSTSCSGYGGGSIAGGGTSRHGAGGTQTAGGSVATSDYTSEGSTTATSGEFGNGGNQTAGKHGGGGGGGGWYGGGAGKCDGYGGGGSGYVYTSTTASSYPSGCLLTSTHYLSNASTTAGNSSITDPETGKTTTGRSGHGYIRITVIETTGLTLYTKVNGNIKTSIFSFCKVIKTWRSVIDVYIKVNGSWRKGG